MIEFLGKIGRWHWFDLVVIGGPAFLLIGLLATEAKPKWGLISCIALGVLFLFVCSLAEAKRRKN